LVNSKVSEEEIIALVSKYFDVIAYRKDDKGDYLLIVESITGNMENEFDKLYKEVVDVGYLPLLTTNEGFLALHLIPRGQQKRRSSLPIALTVITAIMVTISGWYLSLRFWEGLGVKFDTSVVLKDSLLFLGTLMGALGVHELAHYLVARRRGIPVSPPYFIPAPPANLGFLGTFGAVINMRVPPPNLNYLIELGIAGPLAGFLVTIPLAYLGITLSYQVTRPEVLPSEAQPINMVPMILAIMLKYCVPPGVSIYVHPVLLACYFMFLITFLNLLPLGQLDGGHIVRAIVGAKVHYYLGLVIAMISLAMGSAEITGVVRHNPPIFFLIAIFSLFALMLSGQRPHIGGLNIISRMNRKHYLLILVYATLIVLTLPIQLT